MESYQVQKLITISCCIDDLTPEMYPTVIDNLFDLGANDAHLTPIIMKKGRPGIKLEVLCKEEIQNKIVDTIFKETTSIGLKITYVDRIELHRQEYVINALGESIRLKASFLPNGERVNLKPEFEDCKKASDILGISIKEISRIAIREWEKIKE